MKTSIYDLSLQGLEIESLLFDSIGEITPEIQTRMDALLAAGPETMEAAAAVVTQLQMSAKNAEEESARLRNRAREFDAQAAKLKERMAIALDTAFNGKIKTPKWTIYTQKNADRTVADLLPGISAELLHASCPSLVRVKYELDREQAVADFKAGKPLPDLIWFEEKTGDRTCRIK